MLRRLTLAVAAALMVLGLLAAARSGAAQTAAAAHASVTPPAGDTKWVVDPVHSQVEFGIRHLLGRVRGSFTRWYGVIATKDTNWTHGAVKVQVQTASINTGNDYRDTDLRSARFLDTDRFPTMAPSLRSG